MWVYLSTWLVQDGELPEIESGDLLAGYGVRASGRRLGDAEDDDALAQHDGPDPDGFDTVLYELSGTLTWVRPETDEAAIRSEGVDYLARLDDRDWSDMTVNRRVRVLCGFAVVPDYERLAFGLPDVRRDWIVDAIRVEHRAVTWRNGEGVLDRVLRVEPIDRMSRWTDEAREMKSTYLLDLRPASD